MKKFYSAILFVLLLTTISFGQRYVTVPITTTDVGGFIKDDKTGRDAAKPQQTIYLLERNGVYAWVTNVNDNTDYFLWVKAADGPGFLPYVYPAPNAAGNYSHLFDVVGPGGRFENIEFDLIQPNGAYGNRVLNVMGNSRLYMKGCIVSHDRGAFFSINGDSSSIYIEDCFLHSTGHPKSIGGNGRIFDVRNTKWMDSVVVINTTAFNITQRGLRLGTPDIDYVKFDHNTIFQVNRDGVIDAGNANTFILTNNIFFDSPVLGGNLFLNIGPGQGWWCTMVRMDTIKYPDRIKVSNNNFYFQQKYKDIWAQHRYTDKYSQDIPFPDQASWDTYRANLPVLPDSVMHPGFIRKELRDVIDLDKAYFEEVLDFTKTPPDLVDFVKSYWANPNATQLAENWYFGLKDGVDMSYSTTSKSYTAGIDGYPLGDLNWFPALKTRWLNGEVLVSVEKTDELPTEFALEQNYPNPFNPATKIVYSITQATKVKLEVFDILGRLVTTLVDQEQQIGQYRVDFDGSKLTSGVYIYRLSTPGLVQSKKMMLMK